MNKKYALLITIALIAHITNAEQDKPTDDSNYSKKQIEKDYGRSLPLFLDPMCRDTDTRLKEPIVIEDNQEADYVKIIVQNVRLSRSSIKEKGNGTKFTVKENKERVEHFYNPQNNFLIVETFVKHGKKEKCVKRLNWQEITVASVVGKKLRGAINPDQRKTDYNKEKQELTITIPRIIEQTKKTAGNGGQQ